MKTAMNEERILLDDGKTELPIYHYEAIGSTNAAAKPLAGRGCAAILADRQTAGRGRLGRSFFSESGIFMSLTVPASLLGFSPMLLTSAAAFAVCGAIREAGFDAEIKWINDILLAGKKVCGILAEAVTEGDAVAGYAVGIGVNTGAPSFPSELADIACALPLGMEQKRALTEAILRRFYGVLSKTPHEIVAYCTAHSAVIGRRVRFFGAAKGVGTAMGLSPEGGLFVETEGGEVILLTGGEISLRLQ